MRGEASNDPPGKRGRPVASSASVQPYDQMSTEVPYLPPTSTCGEKQCQQGWVGDGRWTGSSLSLSLKLRLKDEREETKGAEEPEGRLTLVSGTVCDGRNTKKDSGP